MLHFTRKQNSSLSPILSQKAVCKCLLSYLQKMCNPYYINGALDGALFFFFEILIKTKFKKRSNLNLYSITLVIYSSGISFHKNVYFFMISILCWRINIAHTLFLEKISEKDCFFKFKGIVTYNFLAYQDQGILWNHVFCAIDRKF